MRLGDRIARIKGVKFLDALEAVCPEFDLPDRLPAHVRCLLPDHVEETPSFYVQESHWWCFGCERGGDAIDFVQHHADVDLGTAVGIAERALGFADADEHADLLARARRRGRVEDVGRGDWEGRVDAVERFFFERVRPYLRCADPVVRGVSWSRADHVFRELDAALGRRPRTERLAREVLRRLWRGAGELAAGLARDVLRMTGKDRLDVALQRGLAVPQGPGAG